jgi:hypothetical protein
MFPLSEDTLRGRSVKKLVDGEELKALLVPESIFELGNWESQIM